MIQKSIITPFAFNFSYNFHHVAYIDLYRFLTCLDKLYTGVVSLSLFSFLRGNIPHFLPGRTDQIEPEDRKRQESDAVVPNREMASVWWTLLTYLRMFLKTQQSGGKMLRQAGSCVRLTLQVLVSVCCSSTYRKHRRGAQRGRRRAATPRSANKLGGKERERLSQWSCVHSFMSFVSPEEISAKLTEPNA